MIYLGTGRAIEEILEEHVEALAFLWGMRCAKLRSPDMAAAAFADIEERIAGHTDALVLAAADAVPMLREGLGGDEPAVGLASGYALLGMEEAEAALLVAEGFRAASGPALEGLSLALSYAPIVRVAAQLREIAGSGPAPQAAAAAEVLAFHGEGDAAIRRIDEFLASSAAAVRKSAWRVVSLLDGVPGVPQARLPATFEAYAKGLRDEDPAVWLQVLETAAWTRQGWLLDYCRALSSDPAPERMPVIRLLSVVGEPADLPVILAAGGTPSLGPARFALLATFGHPSGLELLLEGIRNDDPAVAAAAASAYTTVTGADIDSETRVKLPPSGGPPPDEFEAEFLDEVFLPDFEKACAHRGRTREIFARGERWRHGIDIGDAVPPGLPEPLDNEARWEACLRGRFRGRWRGVRPELERYPLRPRVPGTDG